MINTKKDMRRQAEKKGEQRQSTQGWQQKEGNTLEEGKSKIKKVTTRGWKTEQEHKRRMTTTDELTQSKRRTQA